MGLGLGLALPCQNSLSFAIGALIAITCKAIRLYYAAAK